jgi:predicted nucleic acid-binding protein
LRVALCDTSPLQYLHQIGLLNILPALYIRVHIPPAVAREIEDGHARGVPLPRIGECPWITVRRPSATLAMPAEVGPGELGVLSLAQDVPGGLLIVATPSRGTGLKRFAWNSQER